jgi:hypothetical protein
MDKTKFKVNLEDLEQAQNNARLSYFAGYTKEQETSKKAANQLYFSGWKEAILTSIEYTNKDYTLDLKQSHMNGGWYVVVIKPSLTQELELKDIYAEVAIIFNKNLEIQKREFIECQLALEEQKVKNKLEIVKVRELDKKQKNREKLILQKMAAL